MANLTLAQARQTLFKYGSEIPFASATASDKAEVDAILNQVQDRLVNSGKWRGLIVRAIFNIYNYQITLPHTLEAVLGAFPVDDDDENYGHPMGIYSQWYEFTTNADGKTVDSGPAGMIDLGEGFCTFRDPPTTPFYVKAQSDLAETSKTILLRGLDEDGNLIFTAPSTEGVSLTVDSTGNTTTQQFTFLSYWVKSAATNGIVRLWAVDVTTAVETLIAIIVPQKTVSGYRRYKLPWEIERVEVIAKRAFVAAVVDNDPLMISNTGALKLGMMALQYEDKNDRDRAKQYWNDAEVELEKAQVEFAGDSVMPILQVAGDYGAGSILTLL